MAWPISQGYNERDNLEPDHFEGFSCCRESAC
jgi:hypothetical protein